VRLRVGSDVIVLNREASLAVWLKAVRFHYVPPSFLPAILCSLIAWCSGHKPDIPGFILVVIGVTVNHFGLNMLDDVCDYWHAVDKTPAHDKNPYTGGSGVLTDGLLSPRQLATGAVLCFVVTVVIGLYLSATRGWPVLVLGLFGVFCSVFYTLPPIKFGYRGLGELGLLVNFGPVIGLGAYYVQARTFAIEPLLVSLVLGVMMWSEIVINEIPDYEDDRAGGKMNLVARFGKKKGMLLFVLGLIVAYAILALTVLSGFAPPVLLLGLVSVPLSIKSIVVLRKNYRDKLTMMPANLAMIKAHVLTGVAMIAAYGLHSLGKGVWTSF
jgi:1,4-dihydroxy-2-naphthoate octaprenyltransferase